MTLNIGTIEIPLNAATKSLAFLAKRGGGKSYAAAVLAEEFGAANIPFIVFDPIDVWWGLRLAADGKGKGLPIVVFGIDSSTSDIPLTKDMGREIARAVVEENVSCVISTFGMPKSQQRHLIAEFADELMRINRTPRHVFIEEAHEFVPQRVFGEIGKCFNAVSSLVTMGRNRGIGVTMISQRAATINKDVLTQIDTLIALRNVAPQDRKALKEWVEYHAAAGDFEAFMKSLPTLPTGEAWIWSPEFLNVFERIKIRKRRTFHPDREKMDANFKMPTLEAAHVQDFIGKFSKKMMAEDGKKNADKEAKTAVDAGAKVLYAKERPEDVKIRNEFESQLIAKDGRIRELENDLVSTRRELAVAQGIVGRIQEILGGAPAGAAAGGGSFSSGNLEMWIRKLDKQEATVLRFLAEKSPMEFTRSQIALACGYSVRSGTFNTVFGKLVKNKLALTDGKSYRINPQL